MREGVGSELQVGSCPFVDEEPSLEAMAVGFELGTEVIEGGRGFVEDVP